MNSKTNETKPKVTAGQVAALFGVPVENVRRQYASNARQLRQSEKKAGKGKHRGFTAKQYRGFAEHAEEQAKRKFILVNNDFGYPIYPDAKAVALGKFEATDNRADTYEFVYGEDSPEQKRRHWSASAGIQFDIQPL